MRPAELLARELALRAEPKSDFLEAVSTDGRPTMVEAEGTEVVLQIVTKSHGYETKIVGAGPTEEIAFARLCTVIEGWALYQSEMSKEPVVG